MKPGWRSLLFIAADDNARLAKVGERGADAVILDLEDAIPMDRKASARLALPPTITRLANDEYALIVRINSAWRDVAADLAAAVRPGVAAIMMPKVESCARVSVLVEMIAEASQDAGLRSPPGVIALIESPAGIAELDAIARQPGVIGLALGSEDFSLALGVPPSTDALRLPCQHLALTAARNGVMALGLPVSIATINDLEAWNDGLRLARAIGITGALCIHPRQIAPANMAFMPTQAEAEEAQRVINAWHASGMTGVIQLDGKMIDRPVVLAAERILARLS